LSVQSADAPARVAVSDEPWGTQVRLSAPHLRNALDPDAVAALTEVFARDAAGAVLLRAEGPVFCAGGDLGVLGPAAASGDLAGVLLRGAAAFADLVEAMLTCPRPVVAALGGAAVGGGVALALACDVRIASPEASLVLGWGRWGLPPDGCASALLAAAVGPAVARSLLVQAATVGIDSPYAAALFDRVVAADRLDAAALDLASALAEAPGSRVAKEVATAVLLPAVRHQREAELAAIARAAADPSVVARLAMLYKM
jgi:enoyl-CoA hydratase/carnithine racemase